MSAGKTEEIKLARRAPPGSLAAPAAPAAGGSVGGTCRASAPPSQKVPAPKPWGLEGWSQVSLPRPHPKFNL